MSHMDYAVDRLAWLKEHRDLVKELKFIHEPPICDSSPASWPLTIGAALAWRKPSAPDFGDNF